ncbi:hypothetical protein BDP27DRAFT_280894 [Rhodocollybia butyracea]|uniref:Uncharacterized protein n=1 Tax=Rhodocollybia butyracea TaxID=206335 RepID=A0A9P5Q0Y9_9AGAR|nr:hypothetical protein BDP27DRAFT_280894 [Rhodocollybia butyracea]
MSHVSSSRRTWFKFQSSGLLIYTLSILPWKGAMAGYGALSIQVIEFEFNSQHMQLSRAAALDVRTPRHSKYIIPFLNVGLIWFRKGGFGKGLGNAHNAEDCQNQILA